MSIPLTISQQGLWYLSQSEQRMSAAYNVVIAYKISGLIDLSLLEQSIVELLHRHTLLTARICTKEGVPEFFFDITPEEAVKKGLEHSVKGLSSVLEEEAERPLDLNSGPLFRVILTYDNGVNPCGLVLIFSHMVFDGYSLTVLTTDLEEIFTSIEKGISPIFPADPIEHSKLVEQEISYLAGQEGQSFINECAARLSGIPNLISLPTENQTSPNLSIHKAGYKKIEISEILQSQIRCLCSQQHISHASFFLAAMQVLLWQYSQQNDFGISIPVNFRDKPSMLATVGYLTNLVIFRARLRREQSVMDMLVDTEEQILDLLDARNVPFPSLIRALGKEGQNIQGPLLQLSFNFQKKTVKESFCLGQASFHYVPINMINVKNEFKIDIEESIQGFFCSFIFDRDSFHDDIINRMTNQFILLLDELSRSPEASLRSVTMVTQSEDYYMLKNSPPIKKESMNKCLNEGVEWQASKQPNSLAVIYGDEILSYSDLNGRSNQLACWLRQQGVGPDILVGVCMKRSPSIIVALLGILKAGGAYVPIDPEYPIERLSVLLKSSEVEILITQSDISQQLRNSSDYTGEVLALEADWDLISAFQVDNLKNQIKPYHLAYCIYTSGSTGKPKLVGIQHNSAVSFVCWAIRTFGDYLAKRVLFSTSVAFDLSIFEIFATLSAGGAIVIVENALRLLEKGKHCEVELINTVPSVAEALLKQPDSMAKAKVLNLAGEPLKPTLYYQLRSQYPQLRIFNLYGPTETTTYSTFEELPLEPQKIVPIGKAIDNTRIYLMNEYLELVPIGARGEIYIAGQGVSRGYLHQSELTAESFLPDPFGEPGARMYKTGDIARLLANGSLEFIERIDNQIKIRGFRIEPGEIEYALQQLEGVADAVILSKKDRVGTPYLVAFITERPGYKLEPDRIESSLILPKHLKPSIFLILDALPKNLNGKVDRKQLSLLDISTNISTSERVLPRDPLETQLAGIWADVLNIAEIGVHDDFFVMGGHSLLALQMVSLMSNQGLNVVKVRDVFDFPTVAKLAQAIKNRSIVEENKDRIPRLRRS